MDCYCPPAYTEKKSEDQDWGELFSCNTQAKTGNRSAYDSMRQVGCSKLSGHNRLCNLEHFPISLVLSGLVVGRKVQPPRSESIDERNNVFLST